jgi:hypothetical protein
MLDIEKMRNKGSEDVSCFGLPTPPSLELSLVLAFVSGWPHNFSIRFVSACRIPPCPGPRRLL